MTKESELKKTGEQRIVDENSLKSLLPQITKLVKENIRAAEDNDEIFVDFDIGESEFSFSFYTLTTEDFEDDEEELRAREKDLPIVNICLDIADGITPESLEQVKTKEGEKALIDSLQKELTGQYGNSLPKHFKFDLLGITYVPALVAEIPKGASLYELSEYISFGIRFVKDLIEYTKEE